MERKYPVIIDDVPSGELAVEKSGAATVFEAKCRPAEGIVRLSVYGSDGEGYLGVMIPDENNMLVLRKKLSPSAMRDFPGEIEYASRAGQPLHREAEKSQISPEDEMPQIPQQAAEPQMPPEDELPQIPPQASEPQMPPEDEIPQIPPQAAEPRMPPEDEMPQIPPQAAEPQMPPEDEMPPIPPQAAEPQMPPEDEMPQIPPQASEPQMPQEDENPEQSTSDVPEDIYWYSSPDGALVSFDGQNSFVALPVGDPRIPKGVVGTPREIEGKRYLVYITTGNGVIRM